MSPRWRVVLLLLLLTCGPVEANPLRDRPVLRRTSRQLAGQVLDYTRNHGADNRIWSAALCQPRDLYVYLPPCYDPSRTYPLVIWLHGVAQDEVSFLKDVIVPLDEAMACGRLAPMIVAAPDGSLRGRACYNSLGSFFNNNKAGNFEDYLMTDVWNFLHKEFPIRPEREAHVLAGVSMGAGAAYGKAFKYRDRFKVIVGIFPALNTRWESDRGRYRDDFDPSIARFREDFSRWCEVVARFGLVAVRLGQIIRPLYGRDPEVALHIAADNPLELFLTKDIRPDEFAMLIAYGGRDQFNIDAQVESFLYYTKPRGLRPHVLYDPAGKHDRRTARAFIPQVLEWLGPQMAAYQTAP